MDYLRFKDAAGKDHTASATNPFPVTAVSAGGAVASDLGGAFVKTKPLVKVNRSVSATATAATAVPGNAGRTRIVLQNIDPTNSFWFNLGAAAVANGLGSMRVGPMERVELEGTSDYLSVLAPTAVNVTIWEF